MTLLLTEGTIIMLKKTLLIPYNIGCTMMKEGSTNDKDIYRGSLIYKTMKRDWS